MSPVTFDDFDVNLDDVEQVLKAHKYNSDGEDDGDEVVEGTGGLSDIEADEITNIIEKLCASSDEEIELELEAGDDDEFGTSQDEDIEDVIQKALGEDGAEEDPDPDQEPDATSKDFLKKLIPQKKSPQKAAK